MTIYPKCYALVWYYEITIGLRRNFRTGFIQPNVTFVDKEFVQSANKLFSLHALKKYVMDDWSRYCDYIKLLYAAVQQQSQQKCSDSQEVWQP